MVEQETKRIKPFLTIIVRRGTTRSRAECPEFGIGVGGLTQEGAVAGLHALVRDHSESLLARAQAGIPVDGKPIDPIKADLAKRVVETPREQLLAIFK